VKAAPTRVVTRLPPHPGRLVAVDVGLPPRMPTADAVLPSLLDDPPGRALMAYRPIEHLDDPAGWASETLHVYGSDGRWRRLTMTDFGLPEAWWPGPDMYGVGELSPDGRTWAARAGPSVLLLDLRTAGWRLVRVADRATRVRWARWLPDSRTLQVHSYGTPTIPNRHITHLLDMSGAVRRSPYGRPVAFEPDNKAVVSGPLARGNRAWMSVHGETATVVPRFIEKRGVDDLVVIDRDALTPTARLVNRATGEYLGVTYGWLDDQTVLTSTNSWLVTWTPADGTLHRVARMPTVPAGEYAGWSASVALDLLHAPA